MNFPVWDLAMGSGLLMAIVSILHVFVSHFAVGGGLWLVITERLAYRRGDQQLREYVKSHSKFFILVTLVFGAISGVGIWFTAALISPHSISALIRAYVWGWAMEWVFFLIEIAAAMVYWYGWETLDRKTHMIVGWIYFIAAFASLVIINGIITFMLTPGGWLENHEFWTGFFNPTYWPSAVLRTFAALGQAGLFCLLTTAFLARGRLRDWLSRYNALWVLVSVILVAASTYWYEAALSGAVPGWQEIVAGAVPVMPFFMWLMKVGIIGTAVVALWPILAPRTWNIVGAIVLFCAGLTFFTGGEWVREAARKPYTIHRYMYSTGVLVSDEATIALEGVRAHTRWLNPDAETPQERGGDLFRAWCATCHTMDSYNGLGRFLPYWNDETIAQLLPRLQHMRGNMPAWHGLDDEIEDLAAYLAAAAESYRADWPGFPEDPALAGRQAWDVSCGLCHSAFGPIRPLADSLAGLSREELEADILDVLQDFTDEMPEYLADNVQKAHLLDHLESLATAAEGSE
jgi:mono/diheme cytochrome c family protein/cytochrome bd-type quinol oxidase subunit 1